MALFSGLLLGAFMGVGVLTGSLLGVVKCKNSQAKGNARDKVTVTEVLQVDMVDRSLGPGRVNP